MFFENTRKNMYKRLICYIERHNILYDKQYGFRKYHSTEMAIIELTNKLTYSIAEGKLTTGFCLRFIKSVWYRWSLYYNLKIRTLENLNIGIGGIALQWFRNYLLNRYQIVKFKNSHWDWE